MISQRISQRKLEANRRNASKSTGPKTAAGKKRVSRNRLLHGLASYRCPILPHESELEYRALAAAVVRDLAPRGIVQRELVDQIIQFLWKLRRVPKIEAAIIEINYREAEKRFYRAKRRGRMSGEMSDLAMAPEHLIAGQFCCGKEDRAYERLENYRLRMDRGRQAALRQLEKLRGQTQGEELNEITLLAEAIADEHRAEHLMAREEARWKQDEPAPDKSKGSEERVTEKKCQPEAPPGSIPVTRASGPCEMRAAREERNLPPNAAGTGRRPVSREAGACAADAKALARWTAAGSGSESVRQFKATEGCKSAPDQEIGAELNGAGSSDEASSPQGCQPAAHADIEKPSRSVRFCLVENDRHLPKDKEPKTPATSVTPDKSSR